MVDLQARVAELAKLTAPVPFVSVYLNTRWGDEHHRDRVRVFLKRELKKARQAVADRATDEDLNWIEAEGASLLEQGRFPDARGVALFACAPLGLREVLPLRLPPEDVFVVGEAPYVSPLASIADAVPSVVVMFIDRERARIIPVTPDGAGEEVLLESDVPGQHRRGGWAQLAQSRYQRHIQEHRDRHFDAVAEALISLTGENGIEKVVVAGEPRTATSFRKHLPERIAAGIVGSIAGARYEPGALLVERATELLRFTAREDESVDAVLTEAGKSRKAVAGVQETLEAVSRGAVHRLCLLKGFRGEGSVCVECHALQTGGGPCRLCGGVTRSVELGEAATSRVLAAGGGVITVGPHAALERVGGIAALLRYPL